VGDRDDLDRLLALEEIRRLPLLYAAAIERRDADAMAQLFSPRARFGRWGDGPAGLRALMGETMASSILAVILVANHLVDLDNSGPDRAHGQVWARCYAQDDAGDFVEQLIRYDDAYERVDGRWLFLHRRHRLWFGTAVERSPLAQAPANWPESQVGVGDLPLSDPVFAAWHTRRTR
jgi:hypothetical protein